MPNSYATESEYTCYSCQERTTIQNWLIIDASEKPDLIQQIKDETIQDVVCPACGEAICADLPLLLYFPGDEPRFIFASRMRDGSGYPEIVIRGMFKQLVESSGDQELAGQYHDHRAWVLREDLLWRLKDYPDLPLREFDWSVHPPLKQLEMLVPDEYFGMVLTTYFETSNWNRKARVIQYAPILLTPAVEPYLERMITVLAEQGREQDVLTVQDTLDILIRAREVGYYDAVLEFPAKENM